MRPFGCPVTILNTIDHLGKFDGKADEGFFVGYSTNSKAFRLFNSRTRIVKENLHVQFSENTPNIEGSGPNWHFDIDALTKSMNYKPVAARNQSNGNAGTKACNDAGKARMETVHGKYYILLPMWHANPLFSQDPKSSPNAGFKPSEEEEKKDVEDLRNKDIDVPSTEDPRVNQKKDDNVSSTNNVNTASVNNTNTFNTVSPTVNAAGIEVNYVDPKSSIKLPYDPNMPELEDIVYSDDDEHVDAEADMNNLDAIMPVNPIPTTIIHKDHPVYMNKKDERGIIIKNKARFVAQGYTQEERIDYDEEVYVYQPPGFEDPDFSDRVYKVERHFMDCIKLPKLDDIIFGSTKKSLCTEFEKIMHKKFQISSIGELIFFLGLQVKQKEDGIFISQDKYVTEILNKFGFTDVKTVSTPMETQKPLLKYEDGEEVDVYLYRSMIGSLMYLTSLRPDIIFEVYYPFDLVAYTDSDYDGASLERKSIIGSCQFLGCRLNSWQCKKQTVVANSITKAEYIAASNCCGQSTICIVKNPVFHSNTKHIEIGHHFIRDSNEKKLIQMIKIQTDQNVADLLTKAFDVSRFQ
ncbi:putative ribonuclease H-like domain-containing protein [Tanacetum coccineum]